MSSAGAPHAACDQSTEVTVAAATVATEYAATEALGGLQCVWKHKVAVLGRRIANRTERPLGSCVCVHATRGRTAMCSGRSPLRSVRSGGGRAQEPCDQLVLRTGRRPSLAADCFSPPASSRRHESKSNCAQHNLRCRSIP